MHNLSQTSLLDAKRFEILTRISVLSFLTLKFFQMVKILGFYGKRRVIVKVKMTFAETKPWKLNELREMKFALGIAMLLG